LASKQAPRHDICCFKPGAEFFHHTVSLEDERATASLVPKIWSTRSADAKKLILGEGLDRVLAILLLEGQAGLSDVRDTIESLPHSARAVDFAPSF
jgi:hypothetical protein